MKGITHYLGKNLKEDTYNNNFREAYLELNKEYEKKYGNDISNWIFGNLEKIYENKSEQRLLSYESKKSRRHKELRQPRKPRYKTRTYTRQEAEAIWRLAAEIDARFYLEERFEELREIDPESLNPEYDCHGSMNYDGLLAIASEALINPLCTRMATKQLLKSDFEEKPEETKYRKTLDFVKEKTKRFYDLAKEKIRNFPRYEIKKVA